MRLRWTVPAAMLALTLLGGADGIYKDELACEDAVARLIHCCPNDAVARTVKCYLGRGCDDTRPDLSPTQSVCLRDESCDDLYFSGACENPFKACLP